MMAVTVYEIRARRRRYRAGLRRARYLRLVVAAGGAAALALAGAGVAAAGGSARPMVIFLPDGQPLVQGQGVPGGFPKGGRVVDVPGGVIWERPAGDETQPPPVTAAPWAAG